MLLMPNDITRRLPVLFDRKEGCDIFRVSPATFHRHIKPKLDAVKIGKSVRYTGASGERLIAEQSTPNTGK
jgi:hypothetical protein